MKSESEVRRLSVFLRAIQKRTVDTIIPGDFVLGNPENAYDLLPCWKIEFYLWRKKAASVGAAQSTARFRGPDRTAFSPSSTQH